MVRLLSKQKWFILSFSFYMSIIQTIIVALMFCIIDKFLIIFGFSNVWNLYFVEIIVYLFLQVCCKLMIWDQEQLGPDQGLGINLGKAAEHLLQVNKYDYYVTKFTSYELWLPVFVKYDSNIIIWHTCNNCLTKLDIIFRIGVWSKLANSKYN